MTDVYHLALSRQQVANCRVVLLPGDPGRVPSIARALSSDVVELAFNREYRTQLARTPYGSVLVTSTGIGGPSTAIAIEELAQLGVDTFIRVGTTGAIQPNIEIGDVIVSTGAVRLEGASGHYAPLEYPAVADYYVTDALMDAARTLEVPYHAGITASTDTFYPGQERYETFSGYVPRHFRGSVEEWRNLHVLNFEMEAATLFVVTSAFGLRSGCVCGVLVNRQQSERVDAANKVKAEPNAIAVAAGAAERLLRRGPRDYVDD